MPHFLQIVLRRPWLSDLVAPALSALGLCLCFSRPAYAWLAWVVLIPMAVGVASKTSRAMLYCAAWFSAMIWFLVDLDWIRTSYGGSGFASRNAIYWIVLVALLAPTYPATIWLLHRLSVRTSLPFVLSLPLAWTSMEFLRSRAGYVVAETPFPCFQLGETLINHTACVQIADLAGLWLVTFLVALVNGALVDLLVALRRPRRMLTLVASLTLAFSVLGAARLYGRWRLGTESTHVGPRILLMPSDRAADLCTPPGFDKSLSRTTRLDQADALLWSEMVLHQVLEENSEQRVELMSPDAQQSLAEVLGQHADCCRLPLLIGCTRVDRKAQQRFNSLVYVQPNSPAIESYDKSMLVPWTEFLPWNMAWLCEDTSAQYARGNRQQLFVLGQRGTRAPVRLAPLVCYDICYPHVTRAFFRSNPSHPPDLFVAASCELADQSDTLSAWILTMARCRAIETRRAIVRNAEGGYSGLIDSRGNLVITARERVLSEPLLLPAVPLDGRRTLYMRWGDYFPVLCLIITAVACRPFNRGLRQIAILKQNQRYEQSSRAVDDTI